MALTPSSSVLIVGCHGFYYSKRVLRWVLRSFEYAGYVAQNEAQQTHALIGLDAVSSETSGSASGGRSSNLVCSVAQFGRLTPQ